MTNQMTPAFSESEYSPAEHSELGYPVQVSYLELAGMYMNRIQWQWHTEIEIMLIHKGEVTLLTDDDKICLHAGQGILINQNIIHSVQPTNENINCSLYSVCFHPSFLFGYGNTLMSSKYLTPVISAPFLRTLKLDEQTPLHHEILSLVKDIITTDTDRKFGYELIAKSCLCQLWALLLEQTVPSSAHRRRHTMISLDESGKKCHPFY